MKVKSSGATGAILPILVCLTAVLAGGGPAAAAALGIPRVDGAAIDGQAGDWGGRGYRIGVLADVNGNAAPGGRFVPAIRWGWDDAGLLLLVVIEDDTIIPAPGADGQQQADGFEVTVARDDARAAAVSVSVSPGPGAGTNLITTVTSTGVTGPEPAVDTALREDGDGYTAELRIPWAALGAEAKPGTRLRAQLTVHDSDTGRPRYSALWHHRAGGLGEPDAARTMQLALEPSEPERFRFHAAYDPPGRRIIRVVAMAADAGTEIEVADGGGVAVRTMLRPQAGLAAATAAFPLPPLDAAPEPVTLRAGGKSVGQLDFPDDDAARTRAALVAEVVPSAAVFEGNAFPTFDFEHPLEMRRVLGPYRIGVQYYNDAFEPVDQAESPGRYGAVVTVEADAGTRLVRHATLFRAPSRAGLSWLAWREPMTLHVPDLWQVPDGAEAAGQAAIAKWYRDTLHESAVADTRLSALAAALYTAPESPEPTRAYNDAWARDRQWWVDLKRQLNGAAGEFPHPVTCPEPLDGSPAPTIRPGTPAEAGINPAAVDALDEVCRAWYAASNEPFAFCLVKNGVMFFDRGYGEVDGEPMTTSTPRWMASISKMMSGVLMMTLVDRGLVELDADIAAYVPELRGIAVEQPLTIRRLYTHTNGLQLGFNEPGRPIDHWGDQLHDWEQRVAALYPHLDVGARHGYNGAGYALAGKIIESVSGEAFPQYYRNHLLGPLGMDGTDAIDASALTFSTARDMAALGQMLLNKGAYGPHQFFREATYEQLLPVPIGHLIEGNPNTQWGIGTVWTRFAGLSERAFGHGAASAAVFAVDPDQQLVVVMTRNQGGEAYGEHLNRFFEALAQALAG